MSTSRITVPSSWIVLVEYTFFLVGALMASLFTVQMLLGRHLAGLVGFSDGDPLLTGTVLTIVGLWLFFFVLGIVWAIALFLDSKLVRSADVGWSPSSLLYAVGSLIAGIVPIIYLYKRHEHVSMPSEEDRWWYLVAAFAVLAGFDLLGFGLLVGGVGVVGPLMSAVGYAKLGVGVLLPMAIYRDASHVRTGEGDWTPNPVAYFVAVTFGILVPLVPLALLASGYYLYERHRHVGLPLA